LGAFPLFLIGCLLLAGAAAGVRGGVTAGDACEPDEEPAGCACARASREQAKLRAQDRFVVLPIPTHMHTCIHTYIHTYIHTFIHSYIHTFIHTSYIHTYIHTHIHTYIHTYARTHTYVVSCSHMATYLYTYLYIYIYMPMLARIKHMLSKRWVLVSMRYTHTHTHMLLRSLFAPPIR